MKPGSWGPPPQARALCLLRTQSFIATPLDPFMTTTGLTRLSAAVQGARQRGDNLQR